MNKKETYTYWTGSNDFCFNCDKNIVYPEDYEKHKYHITLSKVNPELYEKELENE